MSQVAAKRRRRQAAQGFTHICEADRPKYKKRDASKAARRLQRQIEKQKAMSVRKGQRKASQE